jgi:hypothetical protein
MTIKFAGRLPDARRDHAPTASRSTRQPCLIRPTTPNAQVGGRRPTDARTRTLSNPPTCGNGRASRNFSAATRHLGRH